ncbi:hypothetical protein G9F71_008330 [Clostridium sp. FP2]|uniref:hypothetical protein n=1 Tax=Clostridium sp. FP2 TaxID=2724481 RepID=UPI0013E93A70|nr:hypothetical protein [Clostridium sp. FP2]MBZ9622858.1 hypothetical protein [Clostridium sp. FP2]
MKKKVIFGNHCAGHLMTKGHILQALAKQLKNNKDFNVYVFNETDEFLKDLNEYKQLQIK